MDWEDDEERAALLPVLFGLAGATSFYDATAVREGEDGWVLCWYGRLTDTSDDWFQRCIRVNAGTGGWIVFPWCEPSIYPTTWLVQFTWMEGTDCPCLTGPDWILAEWEPEGTPFGQWRLRTDVCGGEAFELIFRPNSGSGFTEWSMTMMYGGAEFGDVYFADTICGFLPSFAPVDMTRDGPCPDGILSIVCLPPG